MSEKRYKTRFGLESREDFNLRLSKEYNLLSMKEIIPYPIYDLLNTDYYNQESVASVTVVGYCEPNNYHTYIYSELYDQ